LFFSSVSLIDQLFFFLFSVQANAKTERGAATSTLLHARLLSKLGKQKEAVHHLRTCLQTRIDYVPAMILLASILVIHGR